MAGDVIQKESSGKKKGLRRPKRRIAVRIDMTPMVDIAFLLLIFYMVTTIFAAPQAMEINLPPKDDPSKEDTRVKVKESNLLTVYVDKFNDYYYEVGDELKTGITIKTPWKITPDSIRWLFTEYNKARHKLNTLLVIHPEAKYSRMVDLLDETEVVEAKLKDDADFVKSYLADNPDEKSFSFRYAMDKWGARQDKKFEKVYGLSGGGN